MRPSERRGHPPGRRPGSSMAPEFDAAAACGKDDQPSPALRDELSAGGPRAGTIVALFALLEKTDEACGGLPNAGGADTPVTPRGELVNFNPARRRHA